jgi:hypothetical protein
MGDQYRPLSKRGVPDSDLDNLHEAVMPWMFNAIMGWVTSFWWSQSPMGDWDLRMPVINDLEMALRLRPALHRGSSSEAALDLEKRMKGDPVLAMDVVGYLVQALDRLSGYGASHDAEQLRHILRESGSVWDVSESHGDTSEEVSYFLTRRDVAAARDAITELRDVAERPARFLSAAWLKIATRQPDPAGAYDNAIKAVEAAAQPIVAPKNSRATLGTMIKDMENKPSKWKFALDDGSVEVVIAMCKSLWTNHFRHGTQVREDHTLPEADAAVHLAIPLVRYFGGGIVAPVAPSEA